MTRKVVEKFHKEPRNYEIDFIIGIDDNPSDASNAMFYVRMESIRKDIDLQDKAREIWLSYDEMRELSMLMNMASEFWEKHTLEKDTADTRKRIKKFIEKWKQKRDSTF